MTVLILKSFPSHPNFLESFSRGWCTTATTNITEMATIRRHTTTLVHPFQLTKKMHFCAKRRRRNTHFTSHRSAPCGRTPHVGHRQVRFFSEDMRLSCRYQSRWNARSQRWCQASICQLLAIVKPSVTHSFPESKLSWSGLNMVTNCSWSCQFCLSLYVSICHRAFRTFRSRELFFSHQPTGTPSTVLSATHYRCGRVALGVRRYFRNHVVIHQTLFLGVPHQVTTVAAQDNVNPHAAVVSHLLSDIFF